MLDINNVDLYTWARVYMYMGHQDVQVFNKVKLSFIWYFFIKTFIPQESDKIQLIN